MFQTVAGAARAICIVENGGQQHAPQEIRDSVLSNSVILRILGSYLNFGDLKALRQVSRNFNRNIMEATNFNSRAQIVLRPDRLSKYVFGTTQERWKNIRFEGPSGSTSFYSHFDVVDENIFSPSNFGNRSMDLIWFYPQLSGVEELIIDAALYRNTCNFADPDSLTKLFPHLRLNKVFESAKSLKKLHIHQDLLHGQSEPPDREITEEALKNLVEFSFMGETNFELRRFQFSFPWKNYLKEAIKNLHTIRNELQNPTDNLDVEAQFRLERQDMKFAHEIIQKNHLSLRFLDMADLSVWLSSESPRNLSGTVFPALRSLKMAMKDSDVSSAARFLQKHPLVEDIDLNVSSRGSVELFNFLGDKGGQIKRLCLKAAMTRGFRATNWAFLRKLTNLKDFRLTVAPGARTQETRPDVLGTFQAIFSNLPKKLDNVYFDWVPHVSSLPHLQFASPRQFEQLNPSILTTLCLRSSGGYFDNSILKYIFTNFLNLRRLQLSKHPATFGDRRLAVRRRRRDPFPSEISNLLGLRYLTLNACDGITDDTLVRCIKFQELCELDISHNYGLSEQAILTLLSRNPSLEKVELTVDIGSEFRGLIHNWEMQQKICPRLNEIRTSRQWIEPGSMKTQTQCFFLRKPVAFPRT